MRIYSKSKSWCSIHWDHSFGINLSPPVEFTCLHWIRFCWPSFFLSSDLRFHQLGEEEEAKPLPGPAIHFIVLHHRVWWWAHQVSYTQPNSTVAHWRSFRDARSPVIDFNYNYYQSKFLSSISTFNHQLYTWIISCNPHKLLSTHSRLNYTLPNSNC